jgi:uncharacterized membrane protein
LPVTCLRRSATRGGGAGEYQRLCYNDIQALYGPRLLADKQFPYVEGHLDGGDLSGGAIEYPVLTGVFMWVTALPVDNFVDYLKVSALALMPFGLLVAYLLARQAGWRAMLWAGAPALALYAFHNWDIIAVAASVVGFYLWWRGKPGGAAVSFAIGAALKLYPVLFVLPLMFDVALSRRDRDDPEGAPDPAPRLDLGAALRTGALAAGTWVAINLPFALANFDGWIATYKFHSQRGANYDSIWTAGFSTWTPDKLNLVTMGLTLVSVMAVLAIGWTRARKEGVYPFLQVSGALLAAVMLWSKVHSPQYTIWILPFFVLLRVNIGWWAAYTLADLMVYIGIFRWFADTSSEGFKSLWIYGVWARAALLFALIAVFLISDPSEPEESGAESSRAPPLRPAEGEHVLVSS